jgi:Zn-dependent peptidase ImmA (M78 family)/transcriptional regulator with XRE-family HTH domain
MSARNVADSLLSWQGTMVWLSSTAMSASVPSAPAGQNCVVVERVEVSPKLLAWARDRAGVDDASLAKRFPKLAEWEQGEVRPTVKQLERFAAATHTPVELLRLPEPPDEPVPIPDYRMPAAGRPARPSADLLDTIAQCRQRQRWYRSFVQSTDAEAVPFVASLSTDAPIVDAAADMGDELGFAVDDRGPNFTEAQRRLVDHAEDRGVLVMVNGVVGSNTRRKLNPREFRGIALADAAAPVVFVNGSDLKGNQLFTLAFELAHLFLGTTALSDADLAATPAQDAERWCHDVARELLLPLADVDPVAGREGAEDLAKQYKVTTAVALRRIHDAGGLEEDAYRAAHQDEVMRLTTLAAERPSGGGNFYNTQPVRASKRFTRAVLASALKGETNSGDACQMLGFRKESTLRELARRMGVE